MTSVNSNGPGTLRTAISDANDLAGADSISFNVPGPGVHKIVPGAQLPPITEAVTIDGYTQPGASANTSTTGDDAVLLIELSGEGINGTTVVGLTINGTTVVGLTISATGVVVRGLVVNRWGNGVELSNGAQANRIGNPAVGSGSTIISGNRLEGVYVHGSATDHNLITHSRIGLRADGASALANATGVLISGGAQLNTVGGAAAGDRNVISGNKTSGVLITGVGTDRNVVRGNFIGTAPSGNASVPNGVGVNVTAGAPSNTIGGTFLTPKSLISGNTTAGVRVADATTTGNRIQGNMIGTGPSGTTARPNGAGVIVTAGAQATTVGGSTAPAANWIAFNTGSGVLVDGTTTAGTEIVRNRIFDNGKLAINLRPAGEPVDTATPNDPDDPDSGPNALQNFPVITAANAPPGLATTITGTLNSRPNANFRIDVYRNPAPAATAEAKDFIGSDTTVTTNASGDATWTLTVPANYAGQVLRATATKLDTHDTSELSTTRVVS